MFKGLSFVPVSDKTPVDQFALGIDKLIRTLKIRSSFITFNKNNDKKFIKLQSTFQTNCAMLAL